MVSKKKTRVVDDVVKNAPLKTKTYEQELRRLHVELVKLQQDGNAVVDFNGAVVQPRK